MTIGTAKTYLKLRVSAVGLLGLHLIMRTIIHQPNLFSDLYIYNLIALLCAAIALYSPSFNDQLARVSLSSAIFLWSIGSIVTTWNSFYGQVVWPNTSDICYIIFYPLVLFGLIRALTAQRKFQAIQILDVVIIVGGLSSLIASLFLKSAMSHFIGNSTTVFLSIVYPIGDVVLLAMAVIIVLVQRRALRSLLFLVAISIFTVTDFYFLYKSATTGYSFAQITDDGWLLALVFMAEALWHHGGEVELSEKIIATFTTSAMIFSGVILAISAVNRELIPKVALIPAVATIALAIARLSTALTQARSASASLELARIDELTGLSNRRSFMAEIDQLDSNSGTLLLLDLDGFKNVNDTLGHQAGDELLRQISLRFLRVVPHRSLLARLGGDEFGVVIPGDARLGQEVAQALISTVSYPFIVEGHEVSVGVSIGRVINDGSVDLMRRADIAMYAAKRAGGGTSLWQP